MQQRIRPFNIISSMGFLAPNSPESFTAFLAVRTYPVPVEFFLATLLPCICICSYTPDRYLVDFALTWLPKNQPI